MGKLTDESRIEMLKETPKAIAIARIGQVKAQAEFEEAQSLVSSLLLAGEDCEAEKEAVKRAKMECSIAEIELEALQNHFQVLKLLVERDTVMIAAGGGVE